MKTAALLWASVALLAPRALAVPTETAAPSATSTTSTAPSCTASLIASLCEYPEPNVDFAVASSGKSFCWDYCNAHPPCNFVIFDEGNPYTGTGTCWLYPGESFDANEGSSNCSSPYLSVYNQPVCTGGSPTTTSAGGCAATATPSAIASVCGYPTPEDCAEECLASSGASNCLSLCANSDSCNYAVFNPVNGGNSPYLPGSCWLYPNGTYDAASATTCSGDPTQFVYTNSCPKPTSSPVSASASGATGTGTGTGTATITGSAATATNTAGIAKESASVNSKNSAPIGLALSNPLAVGVAMFMWHAL